MTDLVEADPYTAAARAVCGDIRLITAISINDIRAMGQLIHAQHVLLDEIAAVAEKMCVASVTSRAAGAAILETMVRHGSYDPNFMSQITEVPHGQEDQGQG